MAEPARFGKQHDSTAQFHDFDAYERLVRAAEQLDWRTHLIVLLGGDAGLRCGEMMALEWADVNFETGSAGAPQLAASSSPT